MSLEEVAMMGEALSGLAVFVSLIYLIFELKRTNKSVRTAAAWNADISLAELNEVVMQSPQLSELAMRALDPQTNPEDLSEAEFAQIFLLTRAVLQKYQAQWSMWVQGSLTDEMWQNRRR